ncbi:MAG: hypothetical protein CL944_00775 [Candidatus Diapherotrites archaeon]|uniref:Small ribosomal subunit protein eS24 n=1 Tax=Candidatus Iainarchaeum sp. TaxID=3101447 RepID=A0A2D6LP56_9ARCH|nr:hypothetical protein [Candidatus Diapherotrites archaeon]
MIIQIESKNENPVLNREEVSFIVKETEATPSRQEIRKQVAAQANADEKLLVVDVLDTSYGTSELKGVARIYKNEAEMKKTELKHILVRNFGKDEKAEEKKEAPAAEGTAKAESPEKKEEVKKETAEEKPKEDKAAAKESPKVEEKPVEEKK